MKQNKMDSHVINWLLRYYWIEKFIIIKSHLKFHILFPVMFKWISLKEKQGQLVVTYFGTNICNKSTARKRKKVKPFYNEQSVGIHRSCCSMNQELHTSYFWCLQQTQTSAPHNKLERKAAANKSVILTMLEKIVVQ